MSLHITLGSLVPYTARRYSSKVGRLFGKLVAHEELIRQLLHERVVSAVDIFSTSLLTRVGEVARQECELAIDEAFAIDGPRPTFRMLTDFESVVDQSHYCFLSSGAETHRLGQMRCASIKEPYTITTLIHAVNWPDLMPYYVGLALTSRAFDSIVVTSRAAEAAVSQIIDWLRISCGTPLHAFVTRIPLGLDLNRLPHVGREASRAALALERAAQILLYVGRLSDEYKADLHPLLAVTKTLLTLHPSVQLIAAGQNENRYAEKLRRLAQELGIGRHFTCIENPPDSLKHLLYAASDIFVSPSDCVQESFGLSLLEAMAHRLPIVAADWSGYRDIVIDGETGFLIPSYWDSLSSEAASVLAPMDVGTGLSHYLGQHTIVDVEALRSRLSELLTNTDLRCRMGDAGRQIIEMTYNWPLIVKQYRDLFERQFTLRLRRVDSSFRVLSLNAVFSRYATAALRDDMMVECTSDGRELLRELKSQRQDTDTTLAVQALTRVSNRPCPLGHWMVPFDAKVWDSLLALLKTGRLRLIPS